jgi:hypothetical protein
MVAAALRLTVETFAVGLRLPAANRAAARMLGFETSGIGVGRGEGDCGGDQSAGQGEGRNGLGDSHGYSFGKLR